MTFLDETLRIKSGSFNNKKNYRIKMVHSNEKFSEIESYVHININQEQIYRHDRTYFWKTRRKLIHLESKSITCMIPKEMSGIIRKKRYQV